MTLTRNPLAWIGLAGVERSDNASAQSWQRRLQRPMAGVALMVLLGYMLEMAEAPIWHSLSNFLDVFVFCAFLLETIWIAKLSNRPARFLAANWLNLVILIATFASILGAATEWVALVRILRVAVSGMVLVRAAASFKVLFTRRGAPILVGTVFLILLATGGMFYWVEPTVKTYWEGLWLAFNTGTTIGYGDIVPTTGPAKMVAAFTVLFGVSVMALFTANVVSFFVAGEDARLRQEFRRDLMDLSNKVARLLNAESVTEHADIQALRDDLHRDLHHLRRQVGHLSAADDSTLVRELRQEIGELNSDLRILRAALAKAEAK